MEVTEDGSIVPTATRTYERDPIDKFFKGVDDTAGAVAEAATGVTGAVAGDVAGLGALIADIATFRKFDLDPEGIRQRVREAGTYRAADQNSLPSMVLQAPGKVMSGAGDFLATQAEKTGIPGLEYFARAVPQAAASILGVRAAAPVKSTQGVQLQARIDQRPKPVPEATPEQVAIKGATDAGYRLTPTQVGNKAGGAAEGLSGQAALERSLAAKNVKVTDDLAKKAVGIDLDKPITSAIIGIQRMKANKAYDDVAKTGMRKTSDEYRSEVAGIGDRSGGGTFPEDAPPAVGNLKNTYGNISQFDAGDAVARIRKLRKDANANFKTRDPDKMAVAHVQQKIAEALDNELARHVDEIGRPELAANYKAARVKLAKLNTVEQSLAGSNVSARKIHQQWKRGAPLDGELLAIARAYDSFPHVLQEAAKIRQKQPFSVVDAFVGTAGLALDPALVATVAARPLTRAALASKTYQRHFVAPKGRAPAPSKERKPINPKAGAPAVALREERRKQG